MARTKQTYRRPIPKKTTKSKIKKKPKILKTGDGKKKKRFKPGTVALRQIQKYQRST